MYLISPSSINRKLIPFNDIEYVPRLVISFILSVVGSIGARHKSSFLFRGENHEKSNHFDIISRIASEHHANRMRNKKRRSKNHVTY